MAWNFGDILDANGREVPGDKPALIHGDRVTSWTEFDRRSNALARGLIGRGHTAPIVVRYDLVCDVCPRVPPSASLSVELCS